MRSNEHAPDMLDSRDRAALFNLGERLRDTSCAGEPVRKFFANADWTEADSLRGELDDAQSDDLIRLGMMQRRGAHARPLVRVEVWEGLALSHDFVTSSDLTTGGVMGMGPNAKILSRLTPRKQVRTMLDVGCGQGFHALYGSRHAGVTIGTDVCRRSLRMARINAAMNGVDSVEFRRGHLFEPVSDERFDLIVANPPFVFSPVHQVASGGEPAAGDALVQALIRQTAAKLDDGGCAAFICNWEHSNPERWANAPRAWARSSGCDAWAVRLFALSRDELADSWRAQNDDGTHDALRRWEAHAERANVNIITMGLVFLRKRTGTNWFRSDMLRLAEGDEQAGEQVWNIIENQTLLEEASVPENLLSRRYLATGGREVHRNESGGFVLRHAAGFTFEVGGDATILRLLEACNGERTGQEAAIAATGGGSIEHASQILIELLRRGYLIPVDRVVQ